ncbi:MAG TPA: guanylate kinase [Thermoanaerobacterales bacterium]|jgi:guanylate kinase|nr:guanylate kinase [Thermoanaerobacterales bacterium]
MQTKGMLIVISGPSGVGKGTLCNLLLKRKKNIILSVSTTTRLPRDGEINGKNYFFVSKKDFESMIKENQFLEWAKVYNNYYGTPREFVNKNLEKGKDVLLEIDIQGAKQVKHNCPQAIFIFIMPPSIAELETRIKKRGTETQTSLEVRMGNTVNELKAAYMYDYIVINDDIERAVTELCSIISAEKCRTSRNKDTIEDIIKKGVY